MKTMSPTELRGRCRVGTYAGPTSGHAPGHVQANMAILPAGDAEEFRAFCAANPKPCPLLEVLSAGEFEPTKIAPGADVRTDLPRYRVFRDGVMTEELTDISDIWRDDLVTFLIGCSFIAEDALMSAGLVLPHIEETGTVPMFRTSLATTPAGKFWGPTVVSMRPFTPTDADRAEDITRHYPMAHGAPIHRGDPGALGIGDLARPEYGEPVTMAAGHIPVFWACGVTPQEAILNAKPALAISHAPGHMFVGDMLAEDTRV